MCVIKICVKEEVSMKQHILKKLVFVLVMASLCFSFSMFSLKAAGEMTMEEAKDKVLDLVNLKSKDVTFTKEKKEVENGVEIYVIEFVNKKKTGEYEFEIEVETGDVLEASYEKISWKKQKKSPTKDESVKADQTETEKAGQTETDTGSMLTDQQALAIALQDAGYNAQAVLVKEIHLFTANNGQKIYDIEFVVATDNVEYEYYVDAQEGTILSKEIGNEENDITDDMYDDPDLETDD